MLHLAVIFLLTAILAGLLGFGALASAAAGAARLLFMVSLAMVVLGMFVAALRDTRARH